MRTWKDEISFGYPPYITKPSCVVGTWNVYGKLPDSYYPILIFQGTEREAKAIVELFNREAYGGSTL